MNGVPTVAITGVPDPLPDGLAVVDVREPVEWHYGHIEGAIHIPLARADRRGWTRCPRDRRWWCARWARAPPRRSMWLSRQGRDVVNLDGGLLDWEAAGRALVSETGQPPVVV